MVLDVASSHRMEDDLHAVHASLEAFVSEPAPARRPNYRQGQALEALGHAVEYLIDSRLYLGASGDQAQLSCEADHREAIHLLMRLSREVFLECAQVVPLWTRVGRGLRRQMGRVTENRAAA